MGEPVNGADGAPRNGPDISPEIVDQPETSAHAPADPATVPAPGRFTTSPVIESLEGDIPTMDDPPTSVGSEPRPSVSEIAAALQRVETQVQGFHARAENYEQIIRQMQSRIEQLQGDQVQALLKPVIQRFAGLHAQAAEASDEARERGESAENDFIFFAVAIEEALGLVDIDSVGAAPSVEFDSRKHHASRIVPTDDPGLDQRVQRVLRQGFTYAGAPRVFLPAQVSVYRYEPPPVVEKAPENDLTSEPGEGESGE